MPVIFAGKIRSAVSGAELTNDSRIQAALLPSRSKVELPASNRFYAGLGSSLGIKQKSGEAAGGSGPVTGAIRASGCCGVRFEHIRA